MDGGKEKHTLLDKTKKDFKFWDEKLDIEKLASIWMAYNMEPLSTSVQKANIFGYAGDKYYEAIFDKEENIDENLVKEMILAFNLFEIIVSQTEIYGNTIKKGQIISKVSQVKEDDDKIFLNIQTIINNSLFLGNMIKDYVKEKEQFFKKKEEVLKFLKLYYPFSQGRYFVVAIIGLIIKKCKYEIIESGILYKDKNFLKEKVVAKWLKSILEEILIKQWVEFEKEKGSSLKTFYSSADSWAKIKDEISMIELYKDKKLSEIFPLDMSS